MSDPISTSYGVHAAPKHAMVFPDSEALHIRFSDGSSFPDVTMYCESRDLALDLAAAINAVLARHRDLAGANGRPEGGA